MLFRSKGEVTYYGYHSYAAGDRGAITGRTSNEPEETYSFEQLITAAYNDGGAKARELLKEENGKLTTFKDYTTHNFKFYYMERGAGSSVCRINFNFPVLPKNSIAIGKSVTADSEGGNVEILGNPDFDFQILKVDANGNKTQESYVAEGTE